MFLNIRTCNTVFVLYMYIRPVHIDKKNGKHANSHVSTIFSMVLGPRGVLVWRYKGSLSLTPT